MVPSMPAVPATNRSSPSRLKPALSRVSVAEVAVRPGKPAKQGTAGEQGEHVWVVRKGTLVEVEVNVVRVSNELAIVPFRSVRSSETLSFSFSPPKQLLSF